MPKGTDPLPDASIRVEIVVEGGPMPTAYEKHLPATKGEAIASALRRFAGAVELDDSILGEGGSVRVATYEQAGTLPDGARPPIEEIRRRQAAGEPMLQMRDLPGWNEATGG